MTDAKTVSTLTSNGKPDSAGVMPHICGKTDKLNFAHVFFRTVKLTGAKSLSTADKDVIAKINLTFKALKKAKPPIAENQCTGNTKAEQNKVNKIPEQKRQNNCRYDCQDKINRR